MFGSETLSLTISLKRRFNFARERILPGRTRLGVNEGSRAKQPASELRASELSGLEAGLIDINEPCWVDTQNRDYPSCVQKCQQLVKAENKRTVTAHPEQIAVIAI